MKNLKVFKNKRVIVLGHTGFKGSWLTAWLKELGANIMGISLPPNTTPSNYKVSKICILQNTIQNFIIVNDGLLATLYCA